MTMKYGRKNLPATEAALKPTAGQNQPEPPVPGEDIDPVEEASLESFPASDPPSWIFGEDWPVSRGHSKTR